MEQQAIACPTCGFKWLRDLGSDDLTIDNVALVAKCKHVRDPAQYASCPELRAATSKARQSHRL